MKKELRVYADLVNVLRLHGYEDEDFPDVFDNARGIAKGYLLFKKIEEQETVAEAERILEGDV